MGVSSASTRSDANRWRFVARRLSLLFLSHYTNIYTFLLPFSLHNHHHAPVTWQNMSRHDPAWNKRCCDRSWYAIFVTLTRLRRVTTVPGVAHHEWLQARSRGSEYCDGCNKFAFPLGLHSVALKQTTLSFLYHRLSAHYLILVYSPVIWTLCCHHKPHETSRWLIFVTITPFSC